MRKIWSSRRLGDFAGAAPLICAALCWSIGPAAQAGSADEALLGQAGAALARGDLRTAASRAQEACALADPSHEIAARCALVLGRARFGLGDLAGAASALRSACLGPDGKPGHLGVLEALGEQLWGEALLLGGHAVEAEEPLRRAISSGGSDPAAIKASALLADALLEAGEPQRAAEQAERASALPAQSHAARAALAWTKAQALSSLSLRIAGGAQGDRTQAGPRAREAMEALRTLWRDFPEHPAAAETPALEAQLAAIAAPLAPPTGHDLLQRASHLLSAGQPAQAVQQARAAWQLLAGEDRAEAALLLARTLSADGRRSEATALLEEAWKAKGAGTAAAAGLLLARDRARRSRDPEAVAVADQLVRRFPETTEADDAAFLAARVLLDAGKTEEARKRLLKLAAQHKGGPASDARWALAWLSFREKKRDAIERFAAYAAAAEDDDGRARGLYWQARAGKPALAKALFGRAAALDPLGWYGLLARAALGGAQTAPPPFPPARHPRTTSPIEQARPELRAELAAPRILLQLGMRAEAAGELERYLQVHHGKADELIPALEAMEQAGRTDRSVPVAQQLLIGRPAPLEFREPGRALHGAQDPTQRLLLDLAYPAAFAAEVAEAARRTGLDPYLVLAVARRESVFRPDARSAAGAVGLLQLLPATARRAAAVLGRPVPGDEELVDPARAVDLGTWYLAELIGRFGDPAIAAAAYNAGPRAVSPWARKGAGTPLDEWVEEIPYRETRRYVKVVLGAWGAYRVLAGGAPPRLSATVPAVQAGAEF